MPATDPVFELPPPPEPGPTSPFTFWSSTSNVSIPAPESWAVDFTAGTNFQAEKGSENAVRVVRGGFIPQKQPIIACEAVIGP